MHDGGAATSHDIEGLMFKEARRILDIASFPGIWLYSRDGIMQPRAGWGLRFGATLDRGSVNAEGAADAGPSADDQLANMRDFAGAVHRSID